MRQPNVAELLKIEEPEPVTPPRAVRKPPAAPAPSMEAFLEYAFRPLYLAAAAWAALSVAIWIFAPGLLKGVLNGVFWHAHEMMWGFVATIAVAFLMTAGANWTGVNPLRGPALALACMLWCTARLGFLLGPRHDIFIYAASAELAFFLLAAAAMLRAVHVTRSMRNYAVPWLIVGLGAADFLYLRAALANDPLALLRALDAGLLVMGAIALVVGRRVIPFFAMRAVEGLQVPMLMRVGHLQLALCALAAVLAVLGLTVPLAAALAAIGTLVIAQVIAWRPAAVWRTPLLWILYAGYAGLGAGFLFAGAHMLDWTARAAVHVHVIAMAGFSVLIIGMLTRTALGHLGRPLALDTSMLWSYALVIVAAVSRLFALAPGEWTLPALQVAATAWIVAFGLYVWRFAPMMIRPRAAPPSEFRTAVIGRTARGESPAIVARQR